MTQGRDISGNIEDGGLARAIGSLNSVKAEGTLAVSAGGAGRRLFFHAGELVFASSDFESERFGEMLVKAGKLSRGQLEAALKAHLESGRPLGGVIAGMGLLKPRALFEGVKFQVSGIISACMEAGEGTYRFVHGPLPPETVKLHINVAEAVAAGLRRVEDRERISRDMPGMETVLKMSEAPPELFTGIGLTDDEWGALSMFDGPMPLKDLFGRTGVDDLAARKAVFFLYSIGLLVAVSGPASEPVPGPSLKEAGAGSTAAPGPDEDAVHRAYEASGGQDYYALLDIDAESGQAEIETACARLLELYNPDREYPPGMERMKGELEGLHALVSKAYLVLSDDSRRWEYDLSLAPLISGTSGRSGKRSARDAGAASEAYEKGVEGFRARDFEAATDNFRDATRLDPTRAEYFSHLALALLQRPRREAEAEEAMLEAVRIEPENAELRVNLGLLYKKAGINDKAREAFDEALRLEPDNLKALSEKVKIKRRI